MDFLQIAEFFKKINIEKMTITAYWYSDETDFSNITYFRKHTEEHEGYEEIYSIYTEAKKLLSKEEVDNFFSHFDAEGFYYDEIVSR